MQENFGLIFRTLLNGTNSEVSKRGWREGVGDKQTFKQEAKSSPECVPILLRGHRKKGTEKRPKSLGFEALSANPFSKQWDKWSQIRSFPQIFDDFCRFSLFLGIIAFGRRRFSQKTAGNRRFFAENHRKPQIYAETGLSHLVCPF